MCASDARLRDGITPRADNAEPAFSIGSTPQLYEGWMQAIIGETLEERWETNESSSSMPGTNGPRAITSSPTSDGAALISRRQPAPFEEPLDFASKPSAPIAGSTAYRREVLRWRAEPAPHHVTGEPGCVDSHLPANAARRAR